MCVVGYGEEEFFIGGAMPGVDGVGNSLTSLTGHPGSDGCSLLPSERPIPLCFRFRDRTKKKAAAKISPAPMPNPTASPAINPVCELSDELVGAGEVPDAFAAAPVVKDAGAVSNGNDRLGDDFVICSRCQLRP